MPLHTQLSPIKFFSFFCRAESRLIAARARGVAESVVPLHPSTPRYAATSRAQATMGCLKLRNTAPANHLVSGTHGRFTDLLSSSGQQFSFIRERLGAGALWFLSHIWSEAKVVQFTEEASPTSATGRSGPGQPQGQLPSRRRGSARPHVAPRSRDGRGDRGRLATGAGWRFHSFYYLAD